MTTTDTLLIQRNQVQSLLPLRDCIDAVENAFRLRSEGKASPPGILGVHASDGGFHIKAGILDLGHSYFVAKVNANFPLNKKLHGLPTIQGIIVVSAAENGRLLALMDSSELTVIRTGAATAVAARYLSRKNSKTALICGCGNQGRISVQALLQVRQITKFYIYDIEPGAAELLRRQSEDKIDLIPVRNFASIAKECDIIVTCTTSQKYFIDQNDVSPGTFIAAVGSDNEQKQEIDPRLMKSCKVVTDSTTQCATIGELHHALNDGSMQMTDVYGELGEIIAGQKQGRTSEDEVILFDSTGTALQDVAAAAIVFEKALHDKLTMRLNFSE